MAAAIDTRPTSTDVKAVMLYPIIYALTEVIGFSSDLLTSSGRNADFAFVTTPAVIQILKLMFVRLANIPTSMPFERSLHRLTQVLPLSEIQHRFWAGGQLPMLDSTINRDALGPPMHKYRFLSSQAPD